MSAKHAQNQLGDDLSSTAESVIEQGKDFTKDVKDTVVPLMSTARARVMELGRQVRARAKDNALIVDRYVHDNPWPFIGLGVATGLLASWFLSSRRER